MSEKRRLQIHFSLIQKQLFADLIARSENVGFKTIKHSSNSKLFWSQEEKLQTLQYKINILSNEKGSKLILFFLDSEIQHVSSIFSILGMPTNKQPVLSCNLNLKPKFPSFGVISGFRTHNKEHAKLLPPVNNLNIVPLYSYTQDNFYGIRYVYKAHQAFFAPIAQYVVTLFENWLSIEKIHINATLSSINNNALLSDVFTFHNVEDTVFDRVFGPGWLKALFDDIRRNL